MKKIYVLLSILFGITAYAMEDVTKKIDIPVTTHSFSTIGKRDKQEDQYIIQTMQRNGTLFYFTGIFDGHGGSEVSECARNNYVTFFDEYLDQGKSVDQCLKLACDRCEELISIDEKNDWCGSTVLISCYNDDTKQLSLLWLGDSQAAMSNQYEHTLITSLHRPTEDAEKERIKMFDQQDQTTTLVDDRGMLNRWIAVSRSLGDRFCKSKIPVLIAEPECAVWDVYKENDEGLYTDTGFVVYASDGFWDEVKIEAKDQESGVFDYLWNAIHLSHREFYKKYHNEYGVTKDDSNDDALRSDSEEEHDVNIAQRLVYIAVSHKGSQDNTTVIVQLFGRDQWLFDKDNTSSNSEEDSTNNNDGEVERNSNNNSDTQNDSEESGSDLHDIIGSSDVDTLQKALKDLEKDNQAIADEKDSSHNADETTSGSGEQEDVNVQTDGIEERKDDIHRQPIDQISLKITKDNQVISNSDATSSSLSDQENVPVKTDEEPMHETPHHIIEKSQNLETALKKKKKERIKQVEHIVKSTETKAHVQQSQPPKKIEHGAWASICNNYHYIVGAGMVVALAALVAWYYKLQLGAFVAG